MGFGWVGTPGTVRGEGDCLERRGQRITTSVVVVIGTHLTRSLSGNDGPRVGRSRGLS